MSSKGTHHGQRPAHSLSLATCGFHNGATPSLFPLPHPPTFPLYSSEPSNRLWIKAGTTDCSCGFVFPFSRNVLNFGKINFKADGDLSQTLSGFCLCIQDWDKKQDPGNPLCGAVTWPLPGPLSWPRCQLGLPSSEFHARGPRRRHWCSPSFQHHTSITLLRLHLKLIYCCCLVGFCPVNTPRFTHSFCCQWAFGLPSVWGDEYTCCEHSDACLLVNLHTHFCWACARVCITGSLPHWVPCVQLQDPPQLPLLHS